ncbi:hypothetical protein ACLKA6_005851 [Drosophila palustris]
MTVTTSKPHLQIYPFRSSEPNAVGNRFGPKPNMETEYVSDGLCICQLDRYFLTKLKDEALARNQFSQRQQGVRTKRKRNKQKRKQSQAKEVIDPDTVKMCDCGCYSYSCSHDLSCYSHSHYHSHSHSHHCCAGYKYLKCLCRYYRHVHCTCSCWRRKCYLL